MAIIPRYTNNNCNSNIYGNGNCNYSAWGSYGRWIVLAAIIIGAFFIFLVFSYMTARRRRRQGLQPFRGTGWAQGRTPAGHAPAQYSGAQPYYGNNPNGAAAPPVYSPPATQGYYNQGYNNQGANPGYFGGQQQGVELQQPATVYARGGENEYQPPTGPPPSKTAGDGIIR